MSDKRSAVLADALDAVPTLKRGDQVAYIPRHARGHDGDPIEHPDVEFGFITSINKISGDPYVRYWRTITPPELRKKANSELTPADCVQLHQSVDDKYVQRELLRT